VNTPQSTIRTPQSRALLASIAFWLTLFTAAGLYALVALSPKITECFQQQARWRKNQEKLVRLERKVQYLKQVERALESDPEFAAELARVDLDAAEPGDERIPVERRLTLDAERSDAAQPSSETSPPWYVAIFHTFSERDALRRWTLVAAAVLVLFAFTFLHEPQSPRFRRAVGAAKATGAGLGSAFRWIARRYAKPRRR